MSPTNDEGGFAVVRIDRHGELPSSYLRSFVVAGRNGLQRLVFGDRAAAHLFESRAEAEDVARRLRRRVSAADYDYRVEEVEAAAAAVASEAAPEVGASSS